MANRILIAVVTLAAMSAGFWFAQSRNTMAPVTINAPEFQGWAVTPPRKIAMPQLIRHDGSVYDQQSISGHWSLLFFGYTHCPDVCPATLNVLAQAKKAMPDAFPEVVFVSVDPQRDTVAMLGDYVRYFDTDFTGVTGSAEALKALSLQASIVYMPVATGPDENEYLVEHSSSILLFNPEGRLHAFLGAPHTSQSVLQAIKQLIKQ